MSSKAGARRSTPTPRRQPAPIGTPALAAGLIVLAVTAVAVSAAVTGAASTLQLGDPGPLVRWSLPLVRAVADLAGAVTIGGLLVLSAIIAPDGQAFETGRRVVLVTAITWASTTSMMLLLSAADVAGLTLTSPAYGATLAEFAQSVEVGRLLLIATGMTALTATVVSSMRTPVAAAWSGVLAVLSLLPTALSGHAAGPGHEVVSSGWWLHAIGIGGWTGGLVLLIVLSPTMPTETLGRAATRYSAFALWCYVLVAFSGVASAIPRLTGLSDLWTTGYGGLLTAKALLLAGLGVAGWLHRQRTLPQLQQGRRAAFWSLAVGEVAAMAVAFGLAATLSRTPPPANELPSLTPTPAEIVTGLPLPPPPTPARLVTAFTPDVLWIAIGVALAVGYLALVHRLHRRGDAWKIGHTISWLLGCVALIYVTCGGIAVYGRLFFSLHMVGHMALSMVVPPLLVFGAPVTLLLRALPVRRDGSRGPREWLLAVMESRYVKVITHPVFAGVMFTGSLVAFYYSSLFGLALRTHAGHELMMVHFLLAGYLFTFAVIGVDPAPVRLGYAFRLLLLFITMAFHAFFAVGLMSQETLLQGSYFSSLGWGIDALADQKNGGAIAWGVGDGPTLLLAVVLALQWARSDERLARRRDRAADRDGDAELRKYNEMLAELARRDRSLQQ
jgi:putative copper resistance protein D